MSGLLIVDDQNIVRAGIRKIINGFNMGIEPIYEACNGSKAFILTKKHNPEIIIADIKMPEIDGLSFIRMIKRENISTNIIILSAYSEFEYAKKAIDLQVVSYLLKPVSEEELYHCIVSIRNRNDNKSRSITEKEKEYYDLLLIRYLSGSDIPIEKQQLFDYTGVVKFNYTTFQILIVYTGYENNESLILVKEGIDKLMKADSYTFISLFDFEKKLLIYVLNLDNNVDIKAQNLICSYFSNNSLSLYCGISKLKKGVESLRELYSQALLSLSNGIVSNSKGNAFSDDSGNPIDILARFEINNIVRTIRYSNKNEFMSDIDKICIRLSKERLSLNTVKRAAFNMVESTADTILGGLFKDNRWNSLKEKMQNATDLFQVKILFRQSMSQIFDAYAAKNQDKSNNHIIKHMKEYIYKCYSGDISLTHIANDLNMNYYYLSDLFKKNEGIGFSNYIVQYRLNKARDMLLDKKWKVNEVAHRCGFNDEKYFIRLFKKNFNITPGHYKDYYGSKK